jgi:hypothetical protein
LPLERPTEGRAEELGKVGSSIDSWAVLTIRRRFNRDTAFPVRDKRSTVRSMKIGWTASHAAMALDVRRSCVHGASLSDLQVSLS